MLGISGLSDISHQQENMIMIVFISRHMVYSQHSPWKNKENSLRVIDRLRDNSDSVTHYSSLNKCQVIVLGIVGSPQHKTAVVMTIL